MSETPVEALACVYASLILHDEGLPIEAEQIAKIVSASGVKVAPFWPGLIAKLLENKKVEDLVLSAGGSAAPAAAAAAGGDAAPAAGGDDKKKEEPEEEEDDDMGLGLFD